MRGEKKTELSRCCDSGRSKFLHQNSVGYTRCPVCCWPIWLEFLRHSIYMIST